MKRPRSRACRHQHAGQKRPINLIGEPLISIASSASIIAATVGALRLRLVGAKGHPCADFPLKAGDGDHPAVLLDLAYWALVPK